MYMNICSFSPKAQSNSELRGKFWPLLSTFHDLNHLYSLDKVGGQMGFCIPKLHISLSGALLGNLKMQYRCHQLQKDTEPE